MRDLGMSLSADEFEAKCRMLEPHLWDISQRKTSPHSLTAASCLDQRNIHHAATCHLVEVEDAKKQRVLNPSKAKDAVEMIKHHQVIIPVLEEG
ncbi:hypothetical protein MGYG_04711 [Nannizzia gypsea CBS 118893]|uniref:Uncharacterized protein n=1 Tax=Arthroderma gypseum (strain ATCC MYA-4604 / CBS 118893) TaxID=535722 RepID=E4UWA0_ARTGP|nr:hypothetical protein MGYG_04711 [Nannizzia gypsea CBS 118893]EFR01708.1 hypothetical protein MGYG_04711 [Nannizzia gypsea CBS 118893]